MGWLFSHGDRESLIAHLRSQNRYSAPYVLLNSSVSGSRVWSVIENSETGERTICLDLTQGNGRDGWGYKHMTEDAGPCYYDCPAWALKAAGEPRSEFAKEWRQKVATYRADKAAKKQAITEGAVVAYGDHHYVLLRPCTRVRGRWEVRRVADGMQFSMRAHQLNSARLVDLQALAQARAQTSAQAQP